jgi:hypothetical protein
MSRRGTPLIEGRAIGQKIGAGAGSCTSRTKRTR